MTDDRLFALTLFSVLGSALMAGAFFAFSTFVMKALARLTPPQGIAAMQSINLAVINPWFLTPFLGTAAACSLLAASAVLRRDSPDGWLAAGGLLYVLGTFLVTVAFNVPLNNALARVDPATPDGARVWADYLSRWTTWNHVRTVAALLATGLLVVAISR
jgi:uncharacterized membrane protein